MLKPIDRYMDMDSQNRVVAMALELFEYEARQALPSILAEIWDDGGHATQAVTNLEDLFIVCQVNPNLVPQLVTPIDTDRLLTTIGTEMSQARGIPEDKFFDLLEKPEYTKLNSVVRHVSNADSSFLNVKAVKFGRRKNTVYVAVIESNIDPNHVCMVVFTSSRPSARIKFFNELNCALIQQFKSHHLSAYHTFPKPMNKPEDEGVISKYSQAAVAVASS